MEWYYEAGGEQCGPVPEEEFHRLIREGVITPATLVWREGMTQWQGLSEVLPAPFVPRAVPGSAPPVLAPSIGEVVICSQCGKAFPPDQVLRMGQDAVCASCKPTYVQRLKEGVSTRPEGEQLEKVLAIAKAQKGVIWCILVGLLCYFFLFTVGFAASAAMSGGRAVPSASLALFPQLLFLVVVVVSAVFVYRLAAALEMGAPIVWVLGILCLSCIGLILMLYLSSKATRAIRAAGFKVGIMGARLRDIQAAM